MMMKVVKRVLVVVSGFVVGRYYDAAEVMCLQVLGESEQKNELL